MDWLRSKGMADANVGIDQPKGANLEAILERCRRRNDLNLRRKLERVRLEEAFYNAQAIAMRSRNLQLGEENQLLEGLLQSAKLMVADFDRKKDGRD
jgi:hypothetical protein